MPKLLFAYGFVAAVFPLSRKFQDDLVKVVLLCTPCHLLILLIACLIEYICNALKVVNFASLVFKLWCFVFFSKKCFHYIGWQLCQGYQLQIWFPLFPCCQNHCCYWMFELSSPWAILFGFMDEHPSQHCLVEEQCTSKVVRNL